MRENWVYRRGDVYLADCGAWRGSIQGGIRPVAVMQNNTGNRHSPTLSVVKLTSKLNKKPNQPTHYHNGRTVNDMFALMVQASR